MKRTHRSGRIHPSIVLAGALLACALAATATAAPTRYSPAQGVVVTLDSAPSVVDPAATFTYGLLVVDLADPNVEGVVATPPNEAGGTVSQFMLRKGLVASWAANFGSPELHPCGLLVGESQLWLDGYRDGCIGSAGFGPNGRAELFVGGDPLSIPKAWMGNVVSGKPGLVVDGGLPVTYDCRALGSVAGCERHGRTLLGLDADRQHLVVIAAEGPSDTSSGATLEDMSTLAVAHGVDRAINLVGGTRAGLSVEGLGIVVSPGPGYEVDTCCQAGVRVIDTYPAPIRLEEESVADRPDGDSALADGPEQVASVDDDANGPGPQQGCGCALAVAPRRVGLGVGIGAPVLALLGVLGAWWRRRPDFRTGR